MPKILTKKCCICGDPVWSAKSVYCWDCSVISFRMSCTNKNIPPEAREEIWDYIRKHGKRCYYTGMLLDLRDPKSPWYLVFDHWIPGDGRKVVITSSLFNDMKSDLSENEWWDMIDQLVKYRKYGTPIIKRELRYWKRPYIKMLLPEPPTARPVRYCRICGKPVRFKRSRYCVGCGYLRDRFQSEHFPRLTVRKIWAYVRKHGLRCFYTNVPLDLEDYNSPWHLSFDHRTPGNKKDVVLTCVLFNEMKTDLTEEEFWYYIFQLDNFKKKGAKIRKKKLAHWYRLHPAQNI
jgi:hypothetical protein